MGILIIPVISETLYSSTHWYADTYLGLQEGALQKGIKLMDYHMNAEDAFPEEIRSFCWVLLRRGLTE